LQIVKILRQIRVTILTPQILILPKSSPKICCFLVEYCNLQKNIGPTEDSMSFIGRALLPSNSPNVAFGVQAKCAYAWPLKDPNTGNKQFIDSGRHSHHSYASSSPPSSWNNYLPEAGTLNISNSFELNTSLALFSLPFGEI
jgi:hypothetical protein